MSQSKRSLNPSTASRVAVQESDDSHSIVSRNAFSPQSRQQRLARWRQHFPCWRALSWTHDFMASLFGRITGPLVANRRQPRRHFKLNQLAFCEPLEQRVLLAADFEFAAATTMQSEDGTGGTVPSFAVLGDLTGTTDTQRTVTYAKTGGSATLGGSPGTGDYYLTGTFIIPEDNYATATEIPITDFTVTNDTVVEGNENVTLVITGQGSALTVANVVGGITQNGTDHTIDDNDAAVIEIVPSQTVTEPGGAQTVDVRLSITANGLPGTGTLGAGVSLSADVVDAGGGTAATPADYSAFGTHAVSFSPGDGSGTLKTVPLTTANDTLVEGDETVNLKLQNLNDDRDSQVSLGGTEAVTITDNDTASVSITGGTTTVTEGGATQNVVVTLTVTANGVSGTGSLAVSVTADLPGNSDYSTTAAEFMSGSVSTNTQNIVVTATNDVLVEGPESFMNQMISASTTGVNLTIGVSGAEQIDVVDNDTAEWSLSDNNTVGGQVDEANAASYLLALSGTLQAGEVASVDITLSLPGGGPSADAAELADFTNTFLQDVQDSITAFTGTSGTYAVSGSGTTLTIT